MRNKYPGKCCYCGQPVGPYDGLLTRLGVRHHGCNKAYHATKDKTNAPSSVYPGDTSESSVDSGSSEST